MTGFGPEETARIASHALWQRTTPPGRRVHGARLVIETVPPERKSAVHTMALALVWLTMFSGFFVAFEPAPFDALLVGLVVLLPVVGLIAIGPAQLVHLCLWLLIVAAGFVACLVATDPTAAFPHIGVTLYLALGSVVVAAFVAKRPEAHARLIFRATTAGAMIAAITGILGYFDVPPGANLTFTVFGRAAGSFKDPNAYAPFLVPPLVYLLHQSLANRVRGLFLPLIGMGILAVALLLSFSRGGWVNALVALCVYGLLTLLGARTNRLRVKLISLAGVLVIAGAGLIIVALASDSVSKLFDQRAAVSQSYDEGPEGRFGGQEKAIRHALENPLGLGALQFGGILHPEQPHNVYISHFLNGGWIGGVLYIALIIAGFLLGFRSLLKRRWETPLLPVAYASFAGLAVEGFVVETDHWRTFYVVLGLLWGLTFPSTGKPRLRVPVMGLPADLAMLPMQPPRRAPRITGRAPRIVQPVAATYRPKTRRREPRRKARIVVH